MAKFATLAQHTRWLRHLPKTHRNHSHISSNYLPPDAELWNHHTVYNAICIKLADKYQHAYINPHVGNIRKANMPKNQSTVSEIVPTVTSMNINYFSQKIKFHSTYYWEISAVYIRLHRGFLRWPK